MYYTASTTSSRRWNTQKVKFDMNLHRLLQHVDSLLERRAVRFSKPLLCQETRRDPPSKFSTGGLRHVGEWISTCGFIHRFLSTYGIDRDLFYYNDVGLRFVRALEARVCSLSATQLFQVLVASRLFQAPVEEIVLQELKQQLGNLDSINLLRLHSLLKTQDREFWQSVAKEIDLRNLEVKNSTDMRDSLQTALLDSYRSHIRNT